MTELVQLLSYPFMTRALAAGLVVSVLAGLVGVFAVLRKGAFFGDAIAHSSLAGIAFGLLIGLPPFWPAALYTLFLAIALPSLKKNSRLPLDTLLGILLPLSMGTSVLIFSMLPGYQPDLISFLFGNILAVTTGDLIWLGALTVLALLLLLYLGPKLMAVTIDQDYSQITGMRVNRYEILYHALTALTILAGIQLVGVVLMNALLVIPASNVSLFAKSIKSMLIYTPVVAALTALAGIIVSAILDTPSGATIAVLSGLFFLGGLMIKKLRN